MNNFLNVLLQPSHLAVFAMVAFVFFLTVGKMSKRS
jgi:hypothetical protein